MSYVFGFLGLILFGAMLGVVLARARRRLERQDLSPLRRAESGPDTVSPDTAPLVRETPEPASTPSWFGTAEQRMRTLWTCAAACAAAVVLVAAGAPIVGQLVLVVAVLMSAQVAVMGAIAHIRTRV